MKKDVIHIGTGKKFECDECGKLIKKNNKYFWIGIVYSEYVVCLKCVSEALKQANMVVRDSSSSKDIENFNKSTIKNITEQDSDFLSLNRKIGL